MYKEEYKMILGKKIIIILFFINILLISASANLRINNIIIPLYSLELGKCPDLNSDHIVDTADILGFGSYVGMCEGDEGYLPLLDYDNNGCIEYCQNNPSKDIGSECATSKDYDYFSSFINRKVDCIFENGDINYNGIVDKKDVDLLLKYVSGKKIETDPSKAMLDFNKDDRVDGFDVKALEIYIKKG